LPTHPNYNLSLHDALPIFGAILFHPLFITLIVPALGFGLSILAYLSILMIYFMKYSLLELIVWFLMINIGVTLLVVSKNSGMILDRKSTRLNSSHQIISYA